MWGIDIGEIRLREDQLKIIAIIGLAIGDIQIKVLNTIVGRNTTQDQLIDDMPLGADLCLC